MGRSLNKFLGGVLLRKNPLKNQEEAKKESAAAEEVIRKAREKRALDAWKVEISKELSRNPWL